MKKIVRHLPTALLIFLSLNSCVNQKQKDEEQIKETVTKYWQAVKTNDLQKCNSLIKDSESYVGGIQGQFYFLNKNYEKINPNNILLKNITVKDTIAIDVSAQMKYVQYYIKNPNDSKSSKRPLIITFLFYKEVGYDKIFNPVILQNFIGWDK